MFMSLMRITSPNSPHQRKYIRLLLHRLFQTDPTPSHYLPMRPLPALLQFMAFTRICMKPSCQALFQMPPPKVPTLRCKYLSPVHGSQPSSSHPRSRPPLLQVTPAHLRVSVLLPRTSSTSLDSRHQVDHGHTIKFTALRTTSHRPSQSPWLAVPS